MRDNTAPWRQLWWWGCLILAILCLGIGIVSYNDWNSLRLESIEKEGRIDYKAAKERSEAREGLVGPAGAGRPDKVTIVIGEDGEVESITYGDED